MSLILGQPKPGYNSKACQLWTRLTDGFLDICQHKSNFMPHDSPEILNKVQKKEKKNLDQHKGGQLVITILVTKFDFNSTVVTNQTLLDVFNAIKQRSILVEVDCQWVPRLGDYWPVHPHWAWVFFNRPDELFQYLWIWEVLKKTMSKERVAIKRLPRPFYSAGTYGSVATHKCQTPATSLVKQNVVVVL